MHLDCMRMPDLQIKVLIRKIITAHKELKKVQLRKAVVQKSIRDGNE